MKVNKASVVVAAICVSATLCGAGPLVIAERGKTAEYSIVIPENAAPAQ